MELYKTQESLLMKELDSAVSPGVDTRAIRQKKTALLDLNSRIEPDERYGTLRAHRLIGPVEQREFAAKRYEDLEEAGRAISWNAKRVGRGWLCSDHCIAYVRRTRKKAIDDWGTSIYGDCDEKGNARRDWRTLADGLEAEELRNLSCFWRTRPNVTVEVVSMQRNPCCFWPCVDTLPDVHVEAVAAPIGGDGAGELPSAAGSVASSPSEPHCVNQRNETGVACHCSNHRLHNASERMFRTFDIEFITKVHSLATAMHNPELGPRVLADVDLLLHPEDNQSSD